MQEAQDDTQEACTKRHDHMSQRDLPLSCPPRDKRIWDAHPRVYLPVDAMGRAQCPYCGTAYQVTDDSSST